MGQGAVDHDRTSRFRHKYIFMLQRRAENAALLAPVRSDDSHIQNRVSVSWTQTQRLVLQVIHLHVSTSTRRPHQKTKSSEMTF